MPRFALLPGFGAWAREGRMSKKREDGAPDTFIAILPVLICHENAETRLSFPSLARLSALSGLSPTTASAHLQAMNASNGPWLRILREPIGYGRVKHVYKMGYGQYCGENPRDWIRMDAALIINGIWGAMSPATRRLYLVLRALSWHGAKVEGKPWSTLDCELWPDNAFVPAAHMELPSLVELTGLAGRTVRESKRWMLANGLMRPTDSLEHDGVLMPFDPGRKAPHVLAAIEATKRREADRGYGKASGYARRSMRQMRKVQAEAAQGVPSNRLRTVATDAAEVVQ
jgi:hypothetical protein